MRKIIYEILTFLKVLMRSSRVSDIKLLELPKIFTPNGNITSINSNNEIPFNIKRIYYLYDIPGGESRGGHAHKDLQQLIVAARGSFDVILNDSVEQKKIHLSRPYIGLLLPPGLWREIDNFSSGSICLVLASEEYSESDYIREFDDYLKYKL